MFIVISSILNNSGSVSGVRVFDTDNDSCFDATWVQFCAAVQAKVAFANVNMEKYEPNEGWTAYNMVNEVNELVTTPRFIVSPVTDSNGEFGIIDYTGAVTKFQDTMKLIEFALGHETVNWYGYSVLNGRPLLYDEEVSTSDIPLGVKGELKVAKNGSSAPKRQVNGLPATKERREKAEKSAASQFRMTGMGDQDKVMEWTEQTKAYHESGCAVAESKLAEMNTPLCGENEELCKKQFPHGKTRFSSPKKNTKFVAIGACGENGLIRYGLALVYKKKDEDGTEQEVQWTVVPEDYKHINIATNGTGAVAVCMGFDDKIHLIDLKTSTIRDDINGLQIRDYLNVVPASKKALFMVGVNRDGDKLCYWNVIGDNLSVTKEISCKMELTSQVFSKGRVYWGSLQVAEFIDREDMAIILNLKDFSYDSRMVFKPRGSQTSNMDNEELLEPSWADVLLDFTSGEVKITDEFGNTSMINTFLNIKEGVANKIIGNWLDTEGSIPTDNEVKVRRHMETHKQSVFSRVEYGKVEAVATLLSKFEAYSDMDTILMYLLGTGIKKLEDVQKEFDVTSFSSTLNCDDGNSLKYKGKFIGYNLSAHGMKPVGVMIMFFHKRGGGIHVVEIKMFDNGMSTDSTKHTLAVDNIGKLVNLAETQEVQQKAYDTVINGIKIAGQQEDTPIKKVPRYVRESYKKSGNAIHEPKSNVKIIIADCTVDVGNPVDFKLFLMLNDGLKFNYKKDIEGAISKEGQTVAQKVKQYNRVYSADSPALSANLPSVFSVTVL